MFTRPWSAASKAAIGVALVLLGTMNANAAVTYYLNDSNLSGFSPTGVPNLPAGQGYVSVTLDYDANDPTLIDFTVTPLDPPLVPGNNYGIQKFAFNLNGISLSSSNILNLPGGWNVSFGSNADGFGNFDVVVSDGGQSRQDPLTFQIQAAGDTLDSYFGDSTPANKGFNFAAHVAGIITGAYTTQDPNSDLASDPQYSCNPATYTGTGTCSALTSGWFAVKGALPPSEVPIPPAVWLFGSGLLGMIGIARRKRSLN